MAGKRTAPSILAMKAKGELIVSVTAYDVTSGAIADASGVDLILVGDSLGNVVLGYDSTVGVTMADMVHHVRAARAGVKDALFIADLPFGSYQESPPQAVRSAVELMRAGAEGVKLEGAYVEQVAAITKAGIPVMGHVGLTPQSVHAFGGHKVQGKGEDGERIRGEACAIQDAGAFSIVLELMPAKLAGRITADLDIPTIGIGAGPHCDGQIQVFHDIMGLSERTFKHAKDFAQARKAMAEGMTQYSEEVRTGVFPSQENSF